MDTRQNMMIAALQLLEREGLAQFSTRAICALTQVKAPTLYHHFGSADGLLSAVMAEAFSQFLASKTMAFQSADAVMALREGWDNYVRFAEKRPRLYAAMMSRVLHGANIPAAQQAYAMLMDRIAAVKAQKQLCISAEAAAQLVWASANAAAILFVSGLGPHSNTPSVDVITSLRESAIQTIIGSKSEN